MNFRIRSHNKLSRFFCFAIQRNHSAIVLGVVTLLFSATASLAQSLNDIESVVNAFVPPADRPALYSGGGWAHGSSAVAGGVVGVRLSFDLASSVVRPGAAAAVATECSTDHAEFDQEKNTFIPLAPLPQAAASFAAATGKDDLDYMIGGDNCTGTILGTVYAYNRTTDTWTQKASLPAPRDFARAVAAEDGLIYVIGGVDENGNVLNTVEVYNVDQDSWTAGPPLNVGRSNAAATLDTDGFVVVAGGWASLART